MVQQKIFNIISGMDDGLPVLSAASELFSIKTGAPELLCSVISGFIADDGRFQITPDHKISLTNKGKQYKSLIDHSFIVVDLETTGTKTYKDKITEIAAFKVKGGIITGRFESLVNPGRYIPFNITKITGITNEMVQNAPVIEEIMPEFLDFLGDGIFVAHNAPFDSRFVNAALDEMGFDKLGNQVFCTVKMSRRLFPGYKRYNLDSITKRLGIVISSRHRAAGDAEATAEVLINILQTLPEKNIFSMNELIDVC
ncbi:PolC-type DNA polymerase III [candidate division KSB1 bacterium]